ncbi:MAG: TolB family protein [Janthinobacterium lividum]
MLPLKYPLLAGAAAVALAVTLLAKPAAGSGPSAQLQLLAPGIICTGAYETHPAFSPSGDTLYFLTCSPDLSSNTICVSYRRAGRWTPPEVASFSGQYVDADPFVSRDGQTLYFISDRPVQPGDPSKTDMDIWLVRRGPRSWSAPVHLAAPINSPQDEYYPTLTDGGTLYFGSARPGGFGGSDLYRCPLRAGSPGPAENLGAGVNTADNEYEPFVAPDESYLLFVATHPAGLQHADLYLAHPQAGKWGAVSKLPAPFNSGSTEFSPKVSRDGRTFYFSSTRPTFAAPLPAAENMAQLRQRLAQPGNGLGDIYQIAVSALPLAAPPAGAGGK